MSNSIKAIIVIVFIWSVFGYTFISSLGSILQINNRSIVIPFRATISIFSLILLLLFFKNFHKSINGYGRLFFFIAVYSFIFLFLLRSIVDTLFYLEYLDYSIKLEYWLYTLLVTFLPALAVGLGCKYVEEFLIVKWGVISGFFSIVIAVFSYLNTVGYDLTMLYSGRISLDVLNPITIGNAGLSLILLSFVLLTKYNKINYFTKVIGLISYLLGFLALISAGSRGPFLSLFFCILFIILMSKIALRTIIYILITIVSLIMIFKFYDIYIFNRLKLSFFEDEARSSLVDQALILISNNFFIGSGIFAMENYPHNLLLESFLVLGVFGFIIFLVIFLMNLFYASFMYKREINKIYPLLYIQYCVSGMVSGTLNEVLMFWTLTFCFLFMHCTQSLTLLGNKKIL